MAERQDRRAARTRERLIAAFGELVLQRRRGPIRVAEIVERADVGRSTFYDHYASAEELHLEALARPFAILADAAAGRGDPAKLGWLLAHFWENRVRARDTLGGPGRDRVTGLLAGMIEERLSPWQGSRALPPRLAALQLAEAMLAPIRGWVGGQAPANAADLADSLCRTAAAMLRSHRAGEA